MAEKLRQKLLDMDVNSKLKVARHFKTMDTDGDRSLDLGEFKTGFRSAGMTDSAITDVELEEVFEALDTDGSGTLKMREFLNALTPSMSAARKEMLKEVFQKVDKTGDGLITTADLSAAFAENSPEVKAGTKTAEEVKTAFLNDFEPYGVGRDGKITVEEFEKYYGDVSQRYSSDEEFINMVKGTWGLL